MKRVIGATVAVAGVLLGALGAGQRACGNGGPFVVKHPSGDPAAKGVLARLEPNLKPARETRLRVLKEDLTIRFVPGHPWRGNVKYPPMADVAAAYVIENSTGQEVNEDFGFPILRGIFLKRGMVSYPDVTVQADKESPRATVISNSAIYGIIRHSARGVIEKGIAADANLASLVARVRDAWVPPPQPAVVRQQVAQQPPPAKNVRQERSANYQPVREALRTYLTADLGWNARDAALLVEYASLELVPVGHENQTRGAYASVWPSDRWEPGYFWGRSDLASLATANLGPLAAIGEQKATQLFAQLASRFDKHAGSAYEAIFSAWGGDVRERAVDLETGQLRPRELHLPNRKPAPGKTPVDMRLTADPTVYARLDYLDPNAKISADEKASCQAILKNLPVVFTFAPMNLLHYQVKFPARATRTVTVSYRQYAYADTRGSGSYQLAYVLHPATLWNEFGPIHVRLEVPAGICCKASTAMQCTGEGQAGTGAATVSTRGLGPLNDKAEPKSANLPGNRPPRPSVDVYEATLADPEQKQGELFVGIGRAQWDKMFPPETPAP
jgi:hypothetical protein